MVKLHYEKYSPSFSEDLKELEIFLEKYLPILKSEKAVDDDGDTGGPTSQVLRTFSPDNFPGVYSPPSVGAPEPPADSLHQHVETAGPVSIVDTRHSHTTTHTTSLHDTPYVSPFHLAQPVLVNDDKQKEYEEITSPAQNNPLFSGLLPHAINIQINIPPSDDRQYKETDSYREEKVISVSEAPGYQSALAGDHGGDYGLPPALPSYSPTVTPALPHYNPSTTARPHLLPHHPPPASHHQAGHHPSYEPPTPASIELPHSPHHLVSEFRPPHADYLGMGSYKVFGKNDTFLLCKMFNFMMMFS